MSRGACCGVAGREDVMDVPVEWGVHDEVLCAGKDAVFSFLEAVLSEVIDIFPSALVHIGGDEVHAPGTVQAWGVGWQALNVEASGADAQQPWKRNFFLRAPRCRVDVGALSVWYVAQIPPPAGGRGGGHAL